MIDGNAIVRAIELLKSTYPQEQVQIWTAVGAKGEVSYTATVGGHRHGLESVYWFDGDPVLAAEGLIARAGDRSPETARQKKIANLRKELEELEAQGMAKLVEECCEPKTEVTA